MSFNAARAYLETKEKFIEFLLDRAVNGHAFRVPFLRAVAERFQLTVVFDLVADIKAVVGAAVFLVVRIEMLQHRAGPDAVPALSGRQRRRFYTEPRFKVNDKFLEPVWHRATLDLMAAIALAGPERFVGTVVSYRAGHTLDCDAIRALRRNDLIVPA